MADRLLGQLAVITGASRGIGLAIAQAMVAEGAHVVLASRKAEGLEAAVLAVDETAPGAARSHVLHVGKTESIDAFWAWLDNQGLAPSILVNNAATNPYFGPMIGAEWPAWDKTFDVNLKGPFAMCKAFAQRRIAANQTGAIVNVASIFGLAGAPMQGIYGMTKAALISLSKTLAVEWGSAGIRVNVLAPGLVETRFAAALVNNPALLALFTDRAALGRHAVPEEIAAMVVHLAAPEASFTTGQVFVVDGGYSAT
jgi:NAD(P)-dependent dehydrogenase (short-subunit alcohol dehydrogenase family)